MYAFPDINLRLHLANVGNLMAIEAAKMMYTHNVNVSNRERLSLDIKLH